MTFDPGRLHPDGAPGEAEAYWRKQLGDANYEAARDASKTEQALMYSASIARIARVKAVTGLIGVAASCILLGALVGVGWSFWVWV